MHACTQQGAREGSTDAWGLPRWRSTRDTTACRQHLAASGGCFQGNHPPAAPGSPNLSRETQLILVELDPSAVDFRTNLVDRGRNLAKFGRPCHQICPTSGELLQNWVEVGRIRLKLASSEMGHVWSVLGPLRLNVGRIRTKLGRDRSYPGQIKPMSAECAPKLARPRPTPAAVGPRFAENSAPGRQRTAQGVGGRHLRQLASWRRTEGGKLVHGGKR